MALAGSSVRTFEVPRTAVGIGGGSGLLGVVVDKSISTALPRMNNLNADGSRRRAESYFSSCLGSLDLLCSEAVVQGNLDEVEDGKPGETIVVLGDALGSRADVAEITKAA